NFDTLHRLADKTVLERCAVAIVANSAAFRCAVKGMDRLLEFLKKLFRGGAGERRTSRNAQPKFWYRGHIPNVAKRLVKSRRAGKNCRAGARKISKDGPRRSFGASNQRHAGANQGVEQI